jgi:hypothetical protein
MTTKHTPGPWHRNIKPASKYPIVFAGRNTHVAQIISAGLSEDEVEANMRLISKAPGLLWYVRELVATLEARGAGGPIIDGAKTLVEVIDGDHE